MSLLTLRPLGTATPAPPTPSAEPTFPDVPLIQTRVAWRDEGFSRLVWPGTWIKDGSAISAACAAALQTNFTFGGGTAMAMTTTGTATSGVDYAFGTATTFVSGRPYRFRVGLKNDGAVRIRLGTAADAALASASAGDWQWHTVDWTPAADRTSVYATIQSDTAQTIRFDHAEVYEAWDDITIESLRTTRGSRFDGALEAPGTIDFTLPDGEDRYTPRNTASPLYGLVGPGRKVLIRATHGNWLYPLAYGVIETVTPDPWSRKVTFTCQDGLAELGSYQVSRPFTVDGSYRDARAAALTDEALSTEALALANDSVERDTFTDGTDGPVDLIAYLEGLNEATGSIHGCIPMITARTPWRYRTLTRPFLTSNRAQLSIGDGEFIAVSGADSRDESLITRQRVSWVGYERHPLQVIVQATSAIPYWSFIEEAFGSSDTPEPETIYTLRRGIQIQRGTTTKKGRHGEHTWKWKRRRVIRRRKRKGMRWVDAVVPISIAAGGTATTSVDFQVPMQDVSVAVTSTGSYVTATTEAEPSRLVITMVASSADTVTDIVVTAKPRLPLDEAEVTSTVAGLPRSGGDIDNEHIGSAGQAQGLADYYTWRYGAGRLRPSLVLQHYPQRQMLSWVGQLIRLTARRWFISNVVFVTRAIEHQLDAGGLSFVTTLGLEELPGNGGDWYTLDSSLLDGTAVLAY